MCGCVAYFMPHSSNAKLCEYPQLDCFQRAIENFHLEKTTDNPSLSRNKQIATEKCNCLASCVSLSYEVEIIITRKITLDRERYTFTSNLNYFFVIKEELF